MTHLLLLLFAALLSSSLATFCLPTPHPLTPSFCRNPPLASDLSLPAYTGRWFQIYSSGTASVFSNRCTTANYTLLPSGTVSVLNCQLPQGATRPACITGVASPVDGAPAASLEVSFFPDAPPGPYKVAALLGGSNYGYFGAAVYSCIVTPEGPKEGFFILARAPFMAPFVLETMVKKLKCKGYQIVEPFQRTISGPECTYFDSEAGFDIGPPVRPM